MPLYFFSLTDDPQAKHSGEDLPNDDAAKTHARKIERELTGNSDITKHVLVFDAGGKRIA